MPAPLLSVPADVGATSAPIALTADMLRQAARSGVLEIASPGGARYRVEDVREQQEAGGRWSILGRVRTAIGPQSMVLTIGSDAVFGVIPRPDGRQLHVTTTRGATAVALAGPMAPPGTTAASETDYVVPVQPAVAAQAGHAPVMAASKAVAAAEPAPTRIDVLGLYTDNLVTLRGSVSAAETEITNAFAIANQAHVDSQTGVVLRVTSLRQVAIDASRSNRQALDDITYNRVAGVDLVALRDAQSADLVALVRPYTDVNGSCGNGWLGGWNHSPSSASPAWGFSVSNVAPCSPYVVAHEIGHNIGSMHDIVTSSSNGTVEYGAYPFSFGYRQDGPPAFATIMAYPAANQPRLGYLSSPESVRCGAPCGIAGEADNVLSHRLMASRIAAFRSVPGTVSILDADGFEPEPGLWAASPRLTLRLSGVAPAGGVQVSLQFGGGTALPGVDYVTPPQATYTIPEGQSKWTSRSR